MNIAVLLREIERVRPLAGNLIQTILAVSGADESGPLGVLDGSGKPIASLRTIVRAMEVLNDFAKTPDYFGTIPSRTLHAYYVVERSVGGEQSNRRIGRTVRPVFPRDGSLAGDIRSWGDDSADDSGSGDPSSDSQCG